MPEESRFQVICPTRPTGIAGRVQRPRVAERNGLGQVSVDGLLRAYKGTNGPLDATAAAPLQHGG